jgi:hypothetical protein
MMANVDAVKEKLDMMISKTSDELKAQGFAQTIQLFNKKCLGKSLVFSINTSEKRFRENFGDEEQLFEYGFSLYIEVEDDEYVSFEEVKGFFRDMVMFNLQYNLSNFNIDVGMELVYEPELFISKVAHSDIFQDEPKKNYRRIIKALKELEITDKYKFLTEEEIEAQESVVA